MSILLPLFGLLSGVSDHSYSGKTKVRYATGFSLDTNSINKCQFFTTFSYHTRILLHTIDLATTHSRVIVSCDDTDVLVLLIYYCGKGMLANCKVYTNARRCSETTNRQRFIPVNEITSKIGQDVSICLSVIGYNGVPSSPA